MAIISAAPRLVAALRPSRGAGSWARLAQAFQLAQMRQAERQLEAFLARHDAIP